MKWLGKFEEYAYALMRIAAGGMFSFHGMQKILGILSEYRPAVGTQIWYGGIIELVGGLFIMFGFGTRWAAFIASGEMAVAYIQFHWKFQTGVQALPTINKGELAALYCFIFLFIACKGSGKWSLDR